MTNPNGASPDTAQYSTPVKLALDKFEQADKMGEANLFTKADYLIEAIEAAAQAGVEASDVKRSAAYRRGKDVSLMSHWVAGGMMLKTLQNNLNEEYNQILNKWMSEGRPAFSHYVTMWYQYKGSDERMSPLDVFNFLQDAYDARMGKNTLKAHVLEKMSIDDGEDEVTEKELQALFRRDVTRSYYDVLPLVSDPRTPATVRDLAYQLTEAMQEAFSWLNETDKE